MTKKEILLEVEKALAELNNSEQGYACASRLKDILNKQEVRGNNFVITCPICGSEHCAIWTGWNGDEPSNIVKCPQCKRSEEV